MEEISHVGSAVIIIRGSLCGSIFRERNARLWVFVATSREARKVEITATTAQRRKRRLKGMKRICPEPHRKWWMKDSNPRWSGPELWVQDERVSASLEERGTWG